MKSIKFIKTITEERNGVKVLVEQYEKVTPITEHNSKIEQEKIKLEESKVAENIEVGAVVKEAVDLASKLTADLQALSVDEEVK